MGEAAQHLVAGQVAVGIVELLEVVQVDQQGAQRALPADGFLQGLGGQQVEATAIGQAGEHVGGGQGGDAQLVTARGQVDQEQHQQADQGADQQVEIEAVADAGQGAFLVLVDEQEPVQFGDVAHVEEVAASTFLIVETATLGLRQHRQQRLQTGHFAEQLAAMSTHRPAVGAGQYQAAVAVGEVDGAVVAALVVVDQLDHRIHREADAGHADEVVLVIEHLEVDEEGQAVGVGHVRIDADLVGLGHVAHAEVPGIARLVLADLLEHALGLVVGAALLGDEEAGEGAVVVLDFAQVAGHGLGILLAGDHPVAQEGIARHHRGDLGRADQVLLDLRVDVVRGQRQLGVDDVVADAVARGEVADQAGGEEAAQQQDRQKRQQGDLGLAGRAERHGAGALEKWRNASVVWRCRHRGCRVFPAGARR